MRVILLIGLILASQAAAYKRGDLIKISKRSQYGSNPTGWTPLLSIYCPRYLIPLTAELPGISPADFYPERGFKIALSADHDRFLSPWITVSPKKAELEAIVVTFVVDGDNIKSVSFNAQYGNIESLNATNTNDEAQRKKIRLDYIFEIQEEMDGVLGILALLLTPVGITFLLIVHVIVESVKGIQVRKQSKSDLPINYEHPNKGLPSSISDIIGSTASPRGPGTPSYISAQPVEIPESSASSPLYRPMEDMNQSHVETYSYGGMSITRRNMQNSELSNVDSGAEENEAENNEGISMAPVLLNPSLQTKED